MGKLQNSAFAKADTAPKLFLTSLSQNTIYLTPAIKKTDVENPRFLELTAKQIRTLKEYGKTVHFTERRKPQTLETSIPGFFAVGDARKGSVKRVASAVGEGSMAVSQVHQYLSELVPVK